MLNIEYWLRKHLQPKGKVFHQRKELAGDNHLDLKNGSSEQWDHVKNDLGTYHPLAIANYFLQRSWGKSESKIEEMTLLKLIKLVYMAYGYALATYDRPIIDEAPEIWPYGPVFPSIYHEFKHYGRKPIKEKGTIVVIDDNNQAKDQIVTPHIDDQDNKTQQLLDQVWNKFKHYNVIELVSLTHAKNKAWSKVAGNGQHMTQRNQHIPDQDIKQDFKSLLLST